MFWHNLIYGLIIGLGFIIPGVSGGVIATILGIYEEIIDKLINFKKDVINNFKFIFPLFLGIFLSILIFSKIILYLLANKYYFISYVFIGLILGSIPYLFKEIKNKTNKNISLIPFLITFIFGIFLFYLEGSISSTQANLNIFTMLIAGFIYSIGKIIPGISGAALLMLIGIYEYLLNFLANPILLLDIHIIIKFIPFIISFLLSSIIILKLINYLLKNHFLYTYSAIIGFILSSILFIYPGNLTILNIIISSLSFLISYYLSN